MKRYSQELRLDKPQPSWKLKMNVLEVLWRLKMTLLESFACEYNFFKKILLLFTGYLSGPVSLHISKIILKFDVSIR